MATNAEEKDITQKYVDKFTNKRTVKRLTEEETDDRDDTSTESEGSIQHNEELKKTEEKNR